MSKSKKGSYTPSKPNGSSQNLEATLWAAVDKLWPSIDAAEYTHVVPGIIFLMYIFEAFKEKRASFDVELSDSKSSYYVNDFKARYEAVKDVDGYRAANIFYVPKNARRSYFQSRANLSSIGKDIDDTRDLIEKDNPCLAGVLPKDYARPALDSHRLGELIDLIGTIGLGNKGARSALADGHVNKITETYHAWRSKDDQYKDEPGFCKSSSLAGIQNGLFVLTPGRYVGTESKIDDSDDFDTQVGSFLADLGKQFQQAAKLENEIRTNLKSIGFKVSDFNG